MSLHLRSARQFKLRPSESMAVRAPIIQDHFRCHGANPALPAGLRAVFAATLHKA